MVLKAIWVSFGRLIKEAVERSHRPNVVSWEVGHLGRVARNKPNPLRVLLLAGKEIWFVDCQYQ